MRIVVVGQFVQQLRHSRHTNSTSYARPDETAAAAWPRSPRASDDLGKTIRQGPIGQADSNGFFSRLTPFAKPAPCQTPRKQRHHGGFAEVDRKQDNGIRFFEGIPIIIRHRPISQPCIASANCQYRGEKGKEEKWERKIECLLISRSFLPLSPFPPSHLHNFRWFDHHPKPKLLRVSALRVPFLFLLFPPPVSWPKNRDSISAHRRVGLTVAKHPSPGRSLAIGFSQRRPPLTARPRGYLAPPTRPGFWSTGPPGSEKVEQSSVPKRFPRRRRTCRLAWRVPSPGSLAGPTGQVSLRPLLAAGRSAGRVQGLLVVQHGSTSV